jgi:hypothetical protein
VEGLVNVLLEGLVNLLGAVTALLCAGLLYRGYRRTNVRLLWWSALCFLVLSVENMILFVDFFVVPNTNLVVLRQSIGAAGVACLVFGLVWGTE